MQIKTYVWVKYLATISSIFLLIAPLFVLLKVVSDHFFIASWSTLTAVSVPLYVLGIIGLILYLVFRLGLVKKSTYTYTKKDQLYLILAFGFYLLAALMAGFYLLVGLMIQTNEPILSAVLFGLTYFLVVVGLVGGSIFETLSRVQEQIQLAQDQDLKIRNAKKAKREQLLQNQTSVEAIVEEVLTNRTPEAQNLINRGQKKTKNAADQSTYNPFLDPKLNQEIIAETPKKKSHSKNKKKED